jgi:hypothetical protein
MSGRGLERQHVERVLLQRSPADEGESPIRPEATTNVDKRRGGVSEEHHSEPREGIKKIDVAAIENPSSMTRRTLRLAHGCAKKPSRHRARQALALR